MVARPDAIPSGISGQEPCDIVLEGGTIVDGTGGPSHHSDVGIRDGLIVRIGDLRACHATQRINASDLVVAPGFVDIHTHADEEIERIPLAQNYLQQGVTTMVGGNCGDSIYPVGERLASLEKVGLGVNFAMLVGHSTIRRQVMRMADRAPTVNELEKMKELVAGAMGQGAVGISTGLYYAPGSYARTEEVIDLARVAARYGGIYASHIRDEGDFSIGLVAAVKEVIEVGEKAVIAVHISHLKALGKPVWGKSTEVLDLLGQARARGVDVSFDQYPYVASETSLSGAVVPGWARAGGASKLKERFEVRSTLEKIRSEMALSIEKRGGAEKFFIAKFDPDSSLEGRHLEEIAKGTGKEPVDAAIDLLLAGGADVVSFNMSDDDLMRIMQSSMGMVASDGNAVELGRGIPHPRYYGTFPRILSRYVREEAVLTLEEAVRKMTSGPAHRVGLLNRGLIKEGMIADITVFNPDTIRDLATFERPHQYPVGIDYVIVNGQVAVSEGKRTGVRQGRVLYGRR